MLWYQTLLLKNGMVTRNKVVKPIAMARPAINDDFCFRTRYKSLKKAKEALARYEDGIKDMDTWLYDNNMPIFLDTCVLLNLYMISDIERNAFVEFIEKNKNRIVIASQVEREYNRRRVPQINKFMGQVEDLKTEINKVLDTLGDSIKNIKGGVMGVANKNIVKLGMPEVSSRLKELVEMFDQPQFTTEYEQRLQECKEEIDNHLNEECLQCMQKADFEYSDPVLKALAETVILSSLNQKEQTYIVELYKKLRKAFDETKADKNGDKNSVEITFPGSGDPKKPVDAPIEESVGWGDLYIYHEMLCYMKEHDTDVVFLTRDVTKQDWLKRDKHPFVHYIVNAYEMTGHMMYILNSDDFIPMSFLSVAGQAKKKVDEDSLEELTDDNSIFVDDFEKTMELADWSDIADIFKERHYNDITEDIFKEELQKTMKWATTYGAGYVGENYFLYNILRMKHYNLDRAKEILNRLIESGDVIRNQEEHDGHGFNCLRMNEGAGQVPDAGPA